MRCVNWGVNPRIFAHPSSENLRLNTVIYQTFCFSDRQPNVFQTPNFRPICHLSDGLAVLNTKTFRFFVRVLDRRHLSVRKLRLMIANLLSQTTERHLTSN